MAQAVFVADGGGSKTDLALLGLDGSLLARSRQPAFPPYEVGAAGTAERLDQALDKMQAEIISATMPGAGLPDEVVTVEMAALCFAGLDWEYEKQEFTDAVRGYPWARHGLIVDTDTFPLLRAGTDEATAVAVICGTGMNCVGRAASGATAWFAAIGEVSGDWGGGRQLGTEAIWHAARAADGRGPATILQELTPKALGVKSMDEVTLGYHTGSLDEDAIPELSPVVFQAAQAGDQVALSVVDRQAEEVVAYAMAALRRLGVTGQPCPIVLGGGVLAARPEPLVKAIEAKLAMREPLAYSVIVTDPPVLGAALMAFDALGASPAVLDEVRRSLSGA
ncbi:MAG: N-acetylglucosamine kinase [Micrococcales bacterium]|nr:N-acetylglucosamine kinase [Micrococcales bacterium]